MIPLLLLLLAVSAQDAVNFSLEIPQSFRTVGPGDELLVSFKLINLATSERVDVLLEYWVEDASGSVVLRNKETVAVETQAAFVRYVPLPKSIAPGAYVLHANVTYVSGSRASANQGFEVRAPGGSLWPLALTLVVVLAVLMLGAALAVRSRPALARRALVGRIHSIVRRRLGK